MLRPFLWLAILAACAITLHYVSPGSGHLTGADLIDENGTREVLLERYLWQQGLYPVTGVWSDGHYIDWAEAASRSLWYIPAFLRPDGGLCLFGEQLDQPIAVATEPRPCLSILDVAPTACGALGLQGTFDGSVIFPANASQVVIVYLDGMGWYRYGWAKPVMRNLSALSPNQACCVYPSISRVNSAAMVTGALPEHSGVDRWENRTLLVDDAIGMALRNNVSAAWIDGPQPPLSVPYGIIRPGDANGDGSFDAGIADRAISEYSNGTRLLYVHLFDTDRTLHSSGPYSPQSLRAAAGADILLGRIVGHLKRGTLLIVVADHGGHEIEGCRGDHGSLLPQDMLVPLAVRMCQ